MNPSSLTDLRLAPSSPHSYIKPSGWAETKALRWALSNAVHKSLSECSSNGSMFIRRLPENSTGSWGQRSDMLNVRQLDRCSYGDCPRTAQGPEDKDQICWMLVKWVDVHTETAREQHRVLRTKIRYVECSSNGSMFIRSLPENSTGSWGQRSDILNTNAFCAINNCDMLRCLHYLFRSFLLLFEYMWFLRHHSYNNENLTWNSSGRFQFLSVIHWISGLLW